MKKVFFLLIVLAALFGCSKDENTGLQEDVNKLKERLDAIEKGKTVINVEFKDTNMIITYSSGEKVTLPLPKGLDGINGTNGKDGVGIKTITYNEATAILTITLTNGNTSEFKIVTSGGNLSAVLLSDVNGSCLLSNAYMGGLMLAGITYNDQNQITCITSNTIEDRQQVKNVEVTNEYKDGKLATVTEKRFATANREYWDYTYNDSKSYTINHFAQKPSSEFICTPINDGKYTISIMEESTSNYSKVYSETYKYTYITDSKQTYKSLVYLYDSKAIKLTNTKVIQPNAGFVYSSTLRSSDGKWDNVVYLIDYAEYNFRSSTKLGNEIANNRYAIGYNDKGLMNTITLYRNGTSTPEYQLRLTYNTTNKVAKSEKYVQVNGNWTATGIYLTYEYNQTNQVTKVNRVTPDGKNEKIAYTIYDKNGNPIEIHSLQRAVYSQGYDHWFNPETNQLQRGGQLIKPAGIRLVAKFEYDYQLKNFFGNTISAISPILDQNYKVVNAIKRAWTADEYGANGWIDYKDYDEFGYPKTMILNGGITNGESGLLEIRLSYQKKK